MSYKLNCMRIGNVGFITDKDDYEPGEPVNVIYNAIGTDESYTFSANVDDLKVEYRGSVAELSFTMPDHDVDLKCSSSSMWSPSATPGFGNPLDSFRLMGTIDPKMQTQNDSQVSDSSIGTEWSCLNCDTINTGKFCSRCGNPGPH